MKQSFNDPVHSLLLPVGVMLISAGISGFLQGAGLLPRTSIWAYWLLPLQLATSFAVLLLTANGTGRERTWAVITIVWLVAAGVAAPYLSMTKSWPLLVACLGATIIKDFFRANTRREV